MSFRKSSDNYDVEESGRNEFDGRLISFGIPFLDDALLGIRPDDLLIIGAPSGVGKTQFCTSVAQSALEQGKRVHYFALEADTFEIERRIRYTFIANLYFGDPNRKRLGRPLVYDEWECGMFKQELADLEKVASDYCKSAYQNFFTYYKESQFDVKDLANEVTSLVGQTDLIIVDHVHYFDWYGNDNEAMKEIAKVSRDLVNQFKIPMILVAHLRKRDRQATEIAAGLDEFHGSSDLAKIATKAITIAGGGPTPDGKGFITYMRTPKNRKAGNVTRYQAQLLFDDRTGTYGKDYKLGASNAKDFAPLEPGYLPRWFNRTKRRDGGDSYHG